MEASLESFFCQKIFKTKSKTLGHFWPHLTRRFAHFPQRVMFYSMTYSSTLEYILAKDGNLK